MKNMWGYALVLLLVSTGASPGHNPSLELEHLTWIEAEKALAQYNVVLLALGARSKEHGPHLQLNNDFLMAEYLKDRVAAQVPVAVLPTLQYGYYPAFLDYPGSISLRPETFRDMIVDIARSMSGYGIRKVYILNTGVSTLRPLQQARESLAAEKIELRFLNILEVDEGLPEGLLKQEGGTHADEGETSMMLYIAPETVDMRKAVKDYDPRPNRPGLSRRPEGSGSYSPTGIWGDPTLATREKGRIIVEHTVSEIVREVRELISLELE
jgi:creatinine amidohydrolase